MVDLRGFGGSAGCNDWGGPGEQEDVRAAVEWAAAQPWSTGKVGLFGKSYDGWTGLMGIAQQPKGLAAVIAMEPVYSGYRYLFTDGIRYPNAAGTPASFTLTDAVPGSTSDKPEYVINGTSPNASCYALNIGQQQQDDPTVPFWAVRDLIPKAKGKTTPLFLTQGYLETNTKPDGAFTFFNNMAGPKRAWFGQFDHVRGYEKTGEDYLTGRTTFAEEAMRWLDHYVAGTAPEPKDPPVEVQDIRGRYRAEASWPPADTVMRASALKPGGYTDDGGNNGTGTGAGAGLWTFSQPLTHEVWLAGEAALEVTISDAAPRANLVANLYDVDPDGQATMIGRGAKLLRSGAGKARIDLYGQDWPLTEGHRFGVLLSSANAEWWDHVPTNSTVTVESATISLPFLSHRRDTFLDGLPTTRLDSYLSSAPFPVAADVIEGATAQFDLPGPLTRQPKSAPGRGGRLTARVRRRGRRLTVSGTAPAGARVTITVVRKKRRLARRTVVLGGSVRRYSARLKVRRKRGLRVRVAARTRAGKTLRVSRRA
jgi:predicted acyl esterase